MCKMGEPITSSGSCSGTLKTFMSNMDVHSKLVLQGNINNNVAASTGEMSNRPQLASAKSAVCQGS